MAHEGTVRRGLRTLALVGVAGVVAGVVGWGAFNTAMEATNSLEFCISCHEMRDTVYAEYKTSTHYRNPSGVRAVCADCHVPRDWTHKLVRKVQATGELYHWLAGSIDTREEFEAKRHTLARREWERMRATDSRECRNCHAFDAMDFHRQPAKAATAMQDAMKAGKTCIDCHKGIAHIFPDVDAGHRRAFAALLEQARALAPKPGDTVHALTALDLHAGPPGGEGEPSGGILAGTPAEVVAVADGAVQVRITGWRREGTADTLYALPGKRITRARLTEDAAARAEILRRVTDPDTGQVWTEMRLVAWTRTGGYVPDPGTVWAHAARVYDDACSLCHAPHPPGAYTANDWIGKLNAMARLTRLDGAEVALLRTWLQSHARDTAARTASAAGRP